MDTTSLLGTFEATKRHICFWVRSYNQQKENENTFHPLYILEFTLVIQELQILFIENPFFVFQNIFHEDIQVNRQIRERIINWLLGKMIGPVDL